MEEKEMKTETPSAEKKMEGAKPMAANKSMLVGLAIVVVLVIVGVVAYMMLGKGSKDYETKDGFELYEDANYKFQYPSDWHLQEGSITIVSKKDTEEMEADEISPSLNVVSIGSYDGQYDQEVCDALGEQSMSQYELIFTEPKLESAEITNLDYVSDVCRLEVTATEDDKDVLLVQYAYTDEKAERTYVVTLGTVDEEDLDLLEEMANTFAVVYSDEE